MFCMANTLGSRKLWIYVHLILAAFFMPFLLIMPISGTGYLLDFKGSQEKTEAFRLSTIPTEVGAEQEAFFREEFKKNGIDFDFEYIRGSKTNLIFRPATRVHYTAALEEGGQWVVSQVNPSLMSRLIELHKGHGPRIMRWFEIAFGIALVLTTLSGLWLAWTVKPYRTATIVSFGLGALAIAACMI